MTINELATVVAPIVQSVTSIIGLLAIFFLWLQISQTNNWNKLSAAFSFPDLSKFHEIEQKAIFETQKLKINITNVISISDAEKIRKNDEANLACSALLRHFELLCLAYRNNYVNKEIVINTTCSLIVGYFNNFKNYISVVRTETNNPSAFKIWQKIAIKLENKMNNINNKLKKIS
jgi:hypothetical protein